MNRQGAKSAKSGTKNNRFGFDSMQFSLALLAVDVFAI